MPDREFQISINYGYEGDDNTPTDLTAWLLDDGEWKNLDLNAGSPGFVLFVYTVLHCQHLYLRTNAAERGLLMESSKGSIDVVASKDWIMQRLHVDFEAKLRSGSPSKDDVDYIVGRMQQCPVSRNIKAPADTRTRVTFT